MNYQLLLAVGFGIFLLLVLILKIRLPAFIALLLASITTGLLCGMEGIKVMESVKNGMGSTLGFVATVVGLGSIFGGILEKTGGANAVASFLIRKTGESRANWALMFAGFLVSIPVFFDVGIIILFPMIAAMHRKTKLSILHYAIPLFAGLAVSHAFIPPTPGPMAVSELIGANMMHVILVGSICGIPAAIAGGIFFGKYIGNRLDIQLKNEVESVSDIKQEANQVLSLFMILLPILLIIAGSVSESIFPVMKENIIGKIFITIGHPFSALIIANLMVWFLMGRRMGFKTDQLLDISNKSLIPAGIIILVTGAGGVFKQILIDTGAGKMIAEVLQNSGIGILFFCYLAATIIRVVQGSATVAMITAAGLAAPIIATLQLSSVQIAAVVVSIASGATMLSHVNDSGFWLIKEYLQMDEKQGFRTWTVASSIIGLVGFFMSVFVYYLM